MGNTTSPEVTGSSGGGRGSALPSETNPAPETGSNTPTETNLFGEVLSASESNIASLNDSLEWEIVDMGMEMIDEPPLAMQIDIEKLTTLLESQTENNSIPCSRILIAIIEEDIGSDLADLLLGLSEMNPALQILFLNVNHERTSWGQGTFGMEYPNIERVFCRAKAAFEDSTVDERFIANRAGSVQSYLNYLSLAGTFYVLILKRPCCKNIVGTHKRFVEHPKQVWSSNVYVTSIFRSFKIFFSTLKQIVLILA